MDFALVEHEDVLEHQYLLVVALRHLLQAREPDVHKIHRDVHSRVAFHSPVAGLDSVWLASSERKR